jgi:hypothetical protein
MGREKLRESRARKEKGKRTTMRKEDKSAEYEQEGEKQKEIAKYPCQDEGVVGERRNRSSLLSFPWPVRP